MVLPVTQSKQYPPARLIPVPPVDLLHRVAMVVMDPNQSADSRCQELVQLLSTGWRFSEVTAVRIRARGIDIATPDFDDLIWSLHAAYGEDGGIGLTIEIRVPGTKKSLTMSSFTRSEQDLLDRIADIAGLGLRNTLEALESNNEEEEQEPASQDDRSNQSRMLQLAEDRPQVSGQTMREARLRAMELSQMLAVARERRAIAADIHDSIGQALALIRLRIDACRGDSMFCGFEQSFDDILGLVDQTIEFSRNLSFEISPPILYEFGLMSALEWLGERMEQRHNLAVYVSEVRPPIALPEDVRVTCFAAVREALINVVKHSDSLHAWVSVIRHPDSVCVRVMDKGNGFDTGDISDPITDTGRYGLFGLQGRIINLGGQCHIFSEPGHGTVVSFEVPLNRKSMIC